MSFLFVKGLLVGACSQSCYIQYRDMGCPARPFTTCQDTTSHDPPTLSDVKPQEFKEEGTTEFNIQAFDPDPEDMLSFSCMEADNVFCYVEIT